MVTLDGKPLAGARLLFELRGSQPVRSSYGTTDARGRYVMYKERDAPGVMPGTNTVIITEAPAGGAARAPVEDNATGRAGRRWERTRQVAPGGDHVFDFDLASPGGGPGV